MFAEFPAQNAAEWLEAIHKTLKGQAEDSLHTQLYEGFSTKSFYTREDNAPAMLTENDFSPHHTCLNVVHVYAQNPIEDVLIGQELVGKGADMVCYVFRGNDESKIDLESYLKNSHFPFGIRLEGKLAVKNANAVTPYWHFMETETPLVGATPHTKCFCIDFQPFEALGGNAVQTLAFGLSKLVESINHAIEGGASAENILAQTRISVSIGGNYFVEIAKLRALRVLWRNIAQAYQVPCLPLTIHACATDQNKTREDQYNNLLRNTTEAMAGIIGGADSFMVLPYNSSFSFLENIDQDESIFAERIARNTMILLKEEAHLDKVSDIGAGSYYIEWLTKTIAEYSWKLFQETEAKGGFERAQTDIQKQLAYTAKQRKADFEAGKRVLVGVNRYQDTTSV